MSSEEELKSPANPRAADRLSCDDWAVARAWTASFGGQADWPWPDVEADDKATAAKLLADQARIAATSELVVIDMDDDLILLQHGSGNVVNGELWNVMPIDDEDR